MKKAILLLTAAALSVSALAQKLTIKGSDTVLPLAQKEAELYMKANPGKSVTVTGGGSGVGIAALLDGTTDIAMSSRKIKMDERMKLDEKGKKSKEVIVANDALSVVVHPSNKVTKLTREQIEGIYTGTIKNWKEVGGADMTIVVYARESSSGTYEFFREHVLNKKNHASTVLDMPATGAIIQSVSQTKGAIGYVGLAYVSKGVKSISISYDGGKNFIAATFDSAVTGKYPVVRPLYFYYPETKEATVKAFMNYVLSPAGQQIVQEVGYIPLKKK